MQTARRPRSSPSAALVRLATLAALAGGAAAQGGPWRDGELLARLSSASGLVLNRVDPATGLGSTLLSVQSWGGWAGSLAYDSWRGQVLANCSLAPDPTFFYRLWRISSNGAAVPLPGFDGKSLRAIAPTGDGRVFLMEHPANGPILWIDASDVTHTLFDASGMAPFAFPAEHMIYHAPSNALIASTTYGNPAVCTPGMASFFRIPLSPDGTRVAGPITCTGYATNNEDVMSLDYLPGGRILATLASGAAFQQSELISLDPVTLAILPLANPNIHDINGGYWCAPLGAAVILDDKDNVLRAYTPGSSGAGVVLPTSVAVGDGFTGFSPAESMWQIDLHGPGCYGYADVIGAGLAGSGGQVPSLTLTGCPNLGERVHVVLSGALGGAPGVLAIGLVPASIPAFGGTLLVDPGATLVPVQAFGPAGVHGAGGFDLPVKVSAPVLLGLPIYLQGLFADPGAVQGASLSNGLEIVFG